MAPRDVFFTIQVINLRIIYDEGEILYDEGSVCHKKIYNDQSDFSRLFPAETRYHLQTSFGPRLG